MKSRATAFILSLPQLCSVRIANLLSNKMSFKKKPVLAVDIDEVLARFTPAVIRFHNDNYGSTLSMNDFHSYEFYQVWGGTKEQSATKMASFFESDYFSKGVDPMPQAFDVLKRLRSKFDVQLVTARQFKVEEATRRWIQSFFPELVSDIHFGNHFTFGEKTRSKPEMCKAIGAKMLIDDSYTYASQCAKEGIPTLLFGDYSWNRTPPSDKHLIHAVEDSLVGGAGVCEGENGLIYRVSRWDQVEELVYSVFQRVYGMTPEAYTEASSETAADGVSGSQSSAAAVVTTSVAAIGGNQEARSTMTVGASAQSADTPQETVLMAAIQMCSTNNKEENLRATASLVEEAAARGAKLICLPECSAFMGSGPAETIAAAETIEGPYATALAAVAGRLGVWLSVGGFPEKVTHPAHTSSVSAGTSTSASTMPAEKVANLHFMISPGGRIVSPMYRKIHLFDSPLAGLTESKSTVAGDRLSVVDAGFAKIGLTVCYDLRFPELYGRLCRQPRAVWEAPIGDVELDAGLGAEIVLVPAAFTVKTGRAHWEVLLRARAIENQCYVVAAAQVGKHNEKRESYGGTIIINPWGEVIARCPTIDDKPALTPGTSATSLEDGASGLGSICYATFDRKLLSEVRGNMPVQGHRRRDIYYSTDQDHDHDTNQVLRPGSRT